jgi:hypothetical protein
LTAEFGAEAAEEALEVIGIGMAVQVEPMKPVLTAPGSMLLKLNHDGPLSIFACKFYSGRHTSALSSCEPASCRA